MSVLGIDPSYTRTGLVLLDSAYKVITFSTMSVPAGADRMLRAGKGLHTFITQCSQLVGSPSLVIIEDAAYGAPSRTVVAKLKELTGVYKFIIEAHDIDWLELSPTSAKKWITGKGTAEKYIVARELKRHYGIQFKNDKGFDLSDAAALAVWGVKHYD